MFIRAGSNEVVRPLDYTECLKLFGAALTKSKSTSEKAQSKNVLATSTGNAAGGKSKTPLPPNSARVSTEAPAEAPKAAESPTDVVLTDWLQFLRRAFTDRVSGSYRPKIGIVVAAWDGVPNDTQDHPPINYLGENFPMLEQFIETNHDLFDFQVFGMSILGGDLKNDKDFRDAFTKGKPNDFGFVIHSLNGAMEKANDVTLPVAWALGWLPAIPPTETAT